MYPYLLRESQGKIQSGVLFLAGPRQFFAFDTFFTLPHVVVSPPPNDLPGAASG